MTETHTPAQQHQPGEPELSGVDLARVFQARGAAKVRSEQAGSGSPPRVTATAIQLATPMRMCALRSSVDPKDDRHLDVGVALSVYVVAILGRPEGRPPLS